MRNSARDRIDNLIKKNKTGIKNTLKIKGAVSFLIILLSVLLIFILNKKSEEYKIVKQEIALNKEFLDEEKKLKEALSGYENRKKDIEKLFPKQKDIVNFVSSIETLAGSVSDNVEFSFDNDMPIRDNKGYNNLSYTLVIQTDKTGLINFLDRFEKLPYLTEIVEIRAEDSYYIKGRLYVDEKFYE